MLGIFLFCCNDALGKWLLGSYSVWQMLVIRSVGAIVLLSPFIWREGRVAFAARRGWACRCCGFRSRSPNRSCSSSRVSYLPLADTVTFYLAAPIYVTAISALFLKEQRRLAALECGRGRISSA